MELGSLEKLPEVGKTMKQRWERRQQRHVRPRTEEPAEPSHTQETVQPTPPQSPAPEAEDDHIPSPSQAHPAFTPSPSPPHASAERTPVPPPSRQPAHQARDRPTPRYESMPVNHESVFDTDFFSRSVLT
ncbi:extensin-like [Cornus florida]|uniref:extensin-like n=1 Tax=Cornus florida TaxID=4283 RepID=UPI002896D3A4|nr:extensin-like [Cornus florida]